MNNQPQKPLDPQTFFNRLKLVNLPEDMKNFIVGTFNQLQQTSQINGTFMLVLKEFLLTKKEELNSSEYKAFLTDDVIKKINEYDLGLDMSEQQKGIITLKLEPVETRELNGRFDK
jgi:hypothetical protein